MNDVQIQKYRDTIIENKILREIIKEYIPIEFGEYHGKATNTLSIIESLTQKIVDVEREKEEFKNQISKLIFTIE